MRIMGWDYNGIYSMGSTLARQGVGLLIDNLIFPAIAFQIFNSIAEFGDANLTEVSIDNLSFKIYEWDYYRIFLEFLTFSEN